MRGYVTCFLRQDSQISQPGSALKNLALPAPIEDNGLVMGALLFPAILWAAAAAAVPVAIHLVMRTKPRRIVFPALRFVKKTHQANLSRLRLKHLVLLAMRIAAIIVIALIVARLYQPGWQAVSAANRPVAAVIILDNSASMGATRQDKPLLTRAKEMARDVISQLPPGSRVAVLTTTPSAIGKHAAGFFIANSLEVTRQIEDVTLSCSSQSVWASVRQACGLFADPLAQGGGGSLGRRVVLISDMTTHGWRDGVPLQDMDDTHFTVLDVGLGKDASNVAIAQPRLSHESVSYGSDVILDVPLSAGGKDATISLLAEVDGRRIHEREVTLAAGQSTTVEVPFPATPDAMAGNGAAQAIMTGRVWTKTPDALDIDNVRHFAVHVGQPPEVLIVATAADDDVYRMMSAAVSAGRHAKARMVPAGQLSPAQMSAARCVMLCNVDSLSAQQWRSLDAFVQAGGRLWIVGGPLMTVQSFNSPEAQKLMPASLQGLDPLAQAMPMEGPQDRHAMLAPLQEDSTAVALPMLRCRERFAISAIAADAQVVLRYADKTPAILVRPIGRGNVLFWNIIPTGTTISDGLEYLGVLSQRAVRLMREASQVQLVQWGQDAMVSLPAGLANPVVSVRRPGAIADETVVPDLRIGAAKMTASQVGCWTVRISDGAFSIERVLCVFVDPAESDLAPAAPEELTRFFPLGSLSVRREARLEAAGGSVREDLDMAPVLLVGLLCLLVAESFFANRFYRQTAVNPPSSLPSGR